MTAALIVLGIVAYVAYAVLAFDLGAWLYDVTHQQPIQPTERRER